MQILLAWKSQGLDAAEALQHWTAITESWKLRYQQLTHRPLTFNTAHTGALYLGLISIPKPFRQWQEYYDNHTSAVAWAGIAHNLHETIRPTPGENLNTSFLLQLQHAGDRLLRQINGRFVVGTLHRPSRRLRIILNNYGLSPCFRTSGPYGIAVGTRIAPLLDLVGTPRTPNPTAFLKMFAINWCFGTDTPFENVSQIPQGSEILLKEESTFPEIRTHTPAAYIIEKSRELDKDYLQHGSDAFTTTIIQQLRHSETPLMNLTGGFDSRTIVASAVASGYTPECDVSGEPELREVRLASELANALHVPLHCLAPGEHYAEQLERALQLWSLWTEGMISGYHEFVRSTVSLTPRMRQFFQNYTHIFHGVGGGMGKNFYYATEMLFNSPEPQEVTALLGRYQFENRWLNPRQNARIQDGLEATISEGAALGLRGHQLFDYFYWRERAAHWGGYLVDMQQIGRHVFTPICDPTLTSVFFSMTLPERLLHTWHQYHLQRVFPALAEIPYSKPAPFGELHKRIYNFHPLLYKLCYSLKAGATRLTRRSNTPAAAVYRDREKRGAYLHSYLQKLLFSGEIWWPNVFPFEQGEQMWDDFTAGRYAKPLWDLVTIELWARTFLS